MSAARGSSGRSAHGPRRTRRPAGRVAGARTTTRRRPASGAGRPAPGGRTKRLSDRVVPASVVASAPGRKPPPGSALAVACARAADELQGSGTLLLDVRGLSPIADWMVLTTASTPPHARAVAQAVIGAIASAGRRLHHREGDAGSPWILLDAADVIVHIMDAVTRRSYDLERLWATAPRVRWEAPPPRERG